MSHDERARANVDYATSDCEIKDKVSELCAALKSGNPIPKDTAAWLLLHHAPNKPNDVVSAGAASTCLAGIQDATLLPACRGAMAALLATLALEQGQREFMLRLRSGGRSAVHILLCVSTNSGLALAIREHASASLATLTEEPEQAQVAASLLHASPAPWSEVATVLESFDENHNLRGHLACFLSHAFVKQEVRESCAASAVPEALLAMARHMRRDRHLQGCMACLAALLQQRALWPRFVAAGGLRVVADTLGAPPAGIAVSEFVEHRLWERPKVIGRPPLQHASVRAAVKAAAGPDLLSVSSLAIPFTFDTSVETVTAAAACVHQLIQEPSNVAALLDFAVGSRMAAFAARVFREAAAAADAGKGGGGKKKGAALEPAHLSALREATDCLKVLTLWPEVAIVSAKGGLLPPLVELLCSPDLTLRRNAHMIIGNIALQKDNGKELQQAEVPLECLAGTPMQLPEAAAANVKRELRAVPEGLKQELKIHGHLLNVRQPPRKFASQE